VLNTTLETRFEPGTNLKGDGGGAGWIFLLPSLELGQVVCIGHPGAAALVDLASYATSIEIWQVGSDPSAARAADLAGASVRRTADEFADVASDSVRLIFAAGARGARLVQRPGRLHEEAARVLAPDGVMVLDRAPARGLATGRSYWCSPLIGALQTAVPEADAAATDHYLRNGLDRASVTIESVRPGRSRRGAARTQAPGSQAPATGASRVKTRVKTAVRSFARQSVGLLQSLESHAVRSPLVGRALRRRAQLIGGADAAVSAPPRYLIDLARADGVEISQWSFGLSCGGEYPTRKVLCHLIDPATGRVEAFAKLTRNPIFNDRLETARRALAALERFDLGDGLVVPRSLWFGYHCGRAILGEGAVEGDLFGLRTELTPGCPAAGAAVDALILLSAATRREGRARPEDRRERLTSFCERFEELYCMSDRHRAFLREQVEMLAQASERWPLVFQHGDPHPGNITVTQSGAIGLLDWEAADSEGLPLWDLFHFLWAYCTLSEGARNPAAQARCFDEHFLSTSPFSAWFAKAIDRYCDELAIERELIEPLFHTGWMHRAIREAPRLRPDEVDGGSYVNLLRRGIEGRRSPGLREIFASAGGEAAA